MSKQNNDQIVTIIIPVFNGIHDTLNCLKSISALTYPQKNIEIIIVNNASTDNSAKKINTKYPAIKIINLKKNIGFAGAVNVGIQKAKGNYLFIINNDIKFDKKFLNILTAYLKKHPNAGIVGGKIYSQKNKNKPIFTGVTFNAWTGAIKQLPDNNEIKESGWIQGCAMLLKKKVVEEIGLFDPEYFFSYEDVEFCLKAKKAGFQVMYLPKAHAWHKENTTIDRLGQNRKDIELFKGKYRYVFKNCSPLQIISIISIQFLIIAPIRMLFLQKNISYIQAMWMGFLYNLTKLPQILKYR